MEEKGSFFTGLASWLKRIQVDDAPQPAIVETRVHPCRNRLMVQEDFFTYRGRIVIPEEAKARPTSGRVVEINDPEGSCPVKIGQRIVYGVYAGTKINEGGNNETTKPSYRIMTFEEPIATLDEGFELEKPVL